MQHALFMKMIYESAKYTEFGAFPPEGAGRFAAAWWSSEGAVRHSSITARVSTAEELLYLTLVPHYINQFAHRFYLIIVCTDSVQYEYMYTCIKYMCVCVCVCIFIYIYGHTYKYLPKHILYTNIHNPTNTYSQTRPMNSSCK